jgi:hypothetical protein
MLRVQITHALSYRARPCGKGSGHQKRQWAPGSSRPWKLPRLSTIATARMRGGMVGGEVLLLRREGLGPQDGCLAAICQLLALMRVSPKCTSHIISVLSLWVISSSAVLHSTPPQSHVKLTILVLTQVRQQTLAAGGFRSPCICSNYVDCSVDMYIVLVYCVV